MDRRARRYVGLLTLALVLGAGGGFYTFLLRGRLEDAVKSIEALEQDRNLWKSKAEAAEELIDTTSVSLNHCSAQVDTLRSQLVLMGPGKPRS